MNKELLYSPQNPVVRLYSELHERKRSRQREGLLAVEGIQEIQYALMGAYVPKYLLLRGDQSVKEVFPEFPLSGDVRRLKEELFDTLAVRGSASSALAIMEQKPKPELYKGVYDKVLVLEQVEKPGNLGALFRTALATGCDLVLTTGASTDFYNPNCIRSSVGTVFRVPHAHLESEQAKEFLNDQGLSIWTSRLDGSSSLFEAQLTDRSAFVFGGEHAGLSKDWTGAGMQALRIPMAKEMDSLNLSASAAVVLYEHLRQQSPPSS